MTNPGPQSVGRITREPFKLKLQIRNSTDTDAVWYSDIDDLRSILRFGAAPLAQVLAIMGMAAPLTMAESDFLINSLGLSNNIESKGLIGVIRLYTEKPDENGPNPNHVNGRPHYPPEGALTTSITTCSDGAAKMTSQCVFPFPVTWQTWTV